MLVETPKSASTQDPGIREPYIDGVGDWLPEPPRAVLEPDMEPPGSPDVIAAANSQEQQTRGLRTRFALGALTVSRAAARIVTRGRKTSHEDFTPTELGQTSAANNETSTGQVADGLEHRVEVPEVGTEEMRYREKLMRPTTKEQALLSGTTNKSKPLGGGIELIELDNGEVGIFRTQQSYRSERAAYLVDRSWQFDLVPATVIRKLPTTFITSGIEGSFQERVPDATDGDKIDGFEDIGEYQGQLYKLWILNYSVWDSDGTKRNVVVTDKLHSIDHAQAFYGLDSTKYRAAKEFFGEQAPEDVIEEARSLLSDDVRQQVLLEQLKELMPGRDAESCLARMRHIAQILATKGRIDTKEELAQYSPM